MTTLEDLVRIDGQAHEILKRVGNGTLRAEDVRKAFQQIIEKKFGVPSGADLFSAPPAILGSFLGAVDHYQWPFSREQLQQLRAAMPVNHEGTLSSALCLDIWLGDLPTTFEALWQWVTYVHDQHWRYDGLLSDPEHLRLLDAKRYGKKPSVRWVTIDLTANWDKQSGLRPRDVRKSDSAGLQLLAAGALHPEWIRSIDYETIPGVWLSGLEAKVPGLEAWRDVPVLNWNRDYREVRLDAFWDDDRDSHCALPVVREL